MPALFLLQATPGGAGGLLAFLPMVLIFAIFYFLLVLPMQRQRKKHQQMLSALQNGQQVQTTGGLIGTVTAIDESKELVVVRVKPDGVKLQVARSAIAAVFSDESKS
ncbi:MAG: preprotein translocase subunit YajC [Bryobacterales bacterium]|nr:preprotein translocase subunit YajC [Bryobacterales bacterium]